MSNLFNEINSLREAFVREIKENEEGDLVVTLVELIFQSSELEPKAINQKGGVDGSPYQSSPMFAETEDSRVYELVFSRPDYFCCSVIDEGRTFTNPYDEIEPPGGRVIVYNKSVFLDYVKAETFTDEDVHGAFKHYGILDSDTIVNVASSAPPKINRVN
ncbi:hypothetical protein L1D15_21315 [Vibrio sp. Isolate25]|uniref:hypothetical protein n=1 Tax=Vibrio sp. Isolate25 TaxID=2908535 RepID=UPI001EFDC080|nr:hypothetical protein [Vibrio sp. Isolate25]MCG9599232.1 hypothetical protein [Vibrio sp. Isolate25]